MTDAGDDRTGQRDLLQYVREVAWRQKWVAVVAFAAAIAGIGGLAVWLPNLYRATATVLVETQKVSEDFVRPSVTGELETRLQRIRQELVSRERLGELIQQLDLYPELRSRDVPFDLVIQQMRDDMRLDLTGVDRMSARGPTIAFSISFSGRDPHTVARVANVLASAYVEENTRLRAGQASRTAEILKEQLAKAKAELDDQERRTSGFRTAHRGELPEQAATNFGSLERLNTQLRLNSENQLRALDRRDRLEQQLDGAAGAASSPTTSPRAAELSRLKQELADLRRQFSDAYPDVIRVRDAIASLERHEAESRSTGESAASGPDLKERLTLSINVVNTELQGLKDEEASLRRTIAAYEQRVENLSVRQEQFEALSRDYESTKDRYHALLKRYEEAQLAESMEQGHQVEQFRILDPAIPPRNPVAPGRRRLLLLGFFVSVIFAAAAAFAAEKLDTSFHGLDELQAEVGGAAIFSVPVIQTATGTRRRWRRVALGAVAVVLALTAIVAGSRYVATGNEKITRMIARGAV